MSLKTEEVLNKRGVTKEDKAIWLLKHIREHLTPLDAPLDMYGIDALVTASKPVPSKNAKS